MRKLAVVTGLLVVLMPAGAARASFTQEVGSPVAVGAGPYDVVAADLNGDGRTDLATANGDAGTISVLVRQVGGGFAPEGPALASSPGTTALALADFNLDARLDLASANFQSGGLGNGTVFLRNPIAGYSQEGGPYPLSSPQSAATGDFNGDGLPDVAWGSGFADNVTVFLRKAGGFVQEGGAYTTAGHKSDLAAADVNGDGRVDLVSADDTGGTVSFLLRQAGGGFAAGGSIPAGGRAFGLAVADFNRDGRVDVAATLVDKGAVVVLLGQPGGSFAVEPGSPYPVGATPTGIATGDFNADGAPDLAVANQGGATASVLLRASAGFVPDPSSPLATGQVGPTGVATGDFDGDARTDLAVSNIGPDSVTVFLNTTPPALPGGGGHSPPGIAPNPPSKVKLRPLARTVRFGQRRTRGGATVVTLLAVRKVKRGDRVTLICKGDGCKLRKKTIEVKRDRRSLSLLDRLDGSKLRAGAVLEVRVSRKGATGLVRRWTVRTRKAPIGRTLCLPAGARKPVPCS